MADLLLEIFSEEIPARMQLPAAENLERMITKGLNDAGLPFDKTERFVTPRRLALIVRGVPPMQADKSEERKGPKTSAPDKALEGFLRSTGLSKDQLEVRTVGKDEVYFATIQSKGRPTSEILKEIIEDTLHHFPWPKSMRWGAHDVRWVRPMHSIVCLFDGMVVPVQFGPVQAGNTTRGHRFLAPDTIALRGPDEYVEKLREAFVLADFEERKSLVHMRAKEVAESAGFELKEDLGLLEEVTGLVEWPVSLMGTIADEYMELPPEVLVSEMRGHQKYFAVKNKDGSLANKFLITANMETQDLGKAIVAGNERVLRARLADGRFFWEQDRKKSLANWAEGLKTVTYHAKIGTSAEKVERTKTLALQIAGQIGADKAQVEKAAALCKADLVTGMVDEFPELQGVMGRYYALAQGEPAEVADAIRDHYKPVGPSDSVPSAPVSICVALADKIDTLSGLFAVDEKPTGSKDPFALRRAALGVIRIILENEIRLELATYATAPDLMDFFLDRLKVMLREQGIRHDVIDCAFKATHPEFEQRDLFRLTRYIHALDNTIKSDKGEALVQLTKRVLNILAAEEKKDSTTYAGPADKNDMIDSEKMLAEAVSQAEAAINHGLNEEDFDGVMQGILNLQLPLAAFFDNVLVNDENRKLRENRLKLLASVRSVLDKCGNFGELEG